MHKKGLGDTDENGEKWRLSEREMRLWSGGADEKGEEGRRKENEMEGAVDEKGEEGRRKRYMNNSGEEGSERGRGMSVGSAPSSYYEIINKYPQEVEKSDKMNDHSYADSNNPFDDPNASSSGSQSLKVNRHNHFPYVSSLFSKWKKKKKVSGDDDGNDDDGDGGGDDDDNLTVRLKQKKPSSSTIIPKFLITKKGQEKETTTSPLMKKKQQSKRDNNSSSNNSLINVEFYEDENKGVKNESKKKTIKKKPVSQDILPSLEMGKKKNTFPQLPTQAGSGLPSKKGTSQRVSYSSSRPLLSLITQ
jgi:hypothetical protein